MSNNMLIVIVLAFVIFTIIVATAGRGECVVCGSWQCVQSSGCLSGCVCLVQSGDLTGKCYSIE